MDGQDEAKRVRIAIYVLIAFLVSLYVSYTELAYLVRGKKVTATLTSATVITESSTDKDEIGIRVKYKFNEADGTARTGDDSMAAGWRPPEWDPLREEGKVEVQYTPGEEGRSRVAGHVNWIGLSCFFILLAAMGVQAFMFWRGVQEAIKPSGGKKKK